MRNRFLSLLPTFLLTLAILSFQVQVTYADDPQSESSGWWSPEWRYRRPIDITENSGYSLTNFPVEVTFNHGGKAQPDGDDIRVVINGLEVPSYIPDLSGTHAKVMFEINVTVSSTKTVYVYYGNPDAAKPNYSMVPLTISEGNNGHAIIDNSVYIGWAYTSWGWSNNVELWNDFRIDFNGNNDPTDDADLIRDYGSRQGGIGRHRADIQAIGLGEYRGYVQTPIYIDINFADATLRVYQNNSWVETTQADSLYMFSNSYTHGNCGGGIEQNMIDGKNTMPPYFDSSDVANSKVNPSWMAFRDSDLGYVIASTGLKIGANYAYYSGGKEAPDWDRVINYNNRTRYEPVEPYDQPSDCRIFWYGDNTNGYSNIERTANTLNNRPSVLIRLEEPFGPYVFINQAFVSDDRANVGSTQIVGFHARWDNGSNVVRGIISVERATEESRITFQKVSTGLVGYWKFDEGTGTRAYDSSGLENTGTLINGPAWAEGKHGKALSFDGTDDYVNIPDSPSLRVQSFTLEAWVYMTKRPYQHGYVHVAMINKLNFLGGHSKGYKLDFEKPTSTDDTLVLAIGDGVAQRFLIQYNSINDLTLYEWHHIAGTYDGTTAKLYIDGELKSSSQMTYTIVHDDTPLGIGQEITAAPDTFNGYIDNAMIHNRALDAEEIKAHAQDLVRVTNLSTGQKVELYDNSGNLITGNIVEFGENEALLDVSFLTFPFSGFFKIYAKDGTTLYTSPMFEDIQSRNEYSVSTQIITEIIDRKEFVTNSTGWVTFNVSSSTVGKEVWKVASVNASGVKVFSQLVEDQSIIWDQLNITLQIENSRIRIGSTANVAWNGSYKYDGSTFSGVVSYNDTLAKSVIGIYGYAVASVVDPLYGLTEFETNQVHCIFDRIKTETKFETLTPGTIQAILSLNFEYDNSPVENATVTVNGLAAEYIGNGKYQVFLSSWMPYLQTMFQVERAGFETLTAENVIYPLGNIIFEASSIIAVSATALLLNARRIRMKEWNRKIEKLEELVREKGRIDIGKASEATETEIAKIKQLFSSMMLKNPELKGFFINNDQEFILESSLVNSLNSMRKSELEKIGSDLGITTIQAKEIVSELLRNGKIKGTILLDEKTFTTDNWLNREVRSLVANQVEKTGRIDTQNLSNESLIPKEKITQIIEELNEQIIKVLSPYKQISIADLAHEVKQPERFTLALVKRLVSEGKINGSLDMINHVLTINKLPKIPKPSNAWYLVPLILGILGGVVGYFAVKNDDRKMANNLLYLGIAMTLFGIFIFLIAYSRLWSIMLKLFEIFLS